jgi:acyl-[acyl-carrier-protein]-phospholipid O-acyltransferase/long-chain-fatty-acid--[acyl-carrier-protein] ligase
VFIPSPDSCVEVAEIPVLGTGKLDLRGLRELAESRLGASQNGDA